MIDVLIVEDEQLIADAHQAYLQRLQGFSVTGVAHTARDAMRVAAEAAAAGSPIDLVLLDLGLPDASGIALASALSGLSPARTSSRSPPSGTWRWCGPRWATGRWRIY